MTSPKPDVFPFDQCDAADFQIEPEVHTIMPDYRKGYVKYNNRDYAVTWHPISHEVYVWWGTDKYAGKASDMQGALDTALSWLSSHAR